MYDSILVATDGSETAAAAAEHAIGLARQFDAELSAVTVLESRTEYDNAIVDPEVVEKRRRAAAEETLEDVSASARDASVPIETAIRTGVPHEEILAEADDCEADVIVVGARGRSSLRRQLLGGTVDALVRIADRPVFVIEADE
ncbi:universal stress protein [Natronolimnohabitans innermongolicus]|uniref:UspA domain-containing protein n=1 Tax=Natronolimnohabitans innermongolicus JCM 12255 TaxID=1227499 RepID=L9XE33_9EURY|nr:universal stress protein [Natronolimnohabitans innermongolicus]ELY59975.1 UspA domain-containing protein [Natronolimnohabitans innermongolicus JCM 12255]